MAERALDRDAIRLFLTLSNPRAFSHRDIGRLRAAFREGRSHNPPPQFRQPERGSDVSHPPKSRAKKPFFFGVLPAFVISTTLLTCAETESMLCIPSTSANLPCAT